MMRLIDADALIHELNNSHYPGAPYIDAGISIAIGKVLDALTIRPEPQWIPCSERLPEDEQFILVTYKTTDRIHVCQYHEDGSRNQWYSLNDMCRAHNNVVLAWMPLPEPYREEGGE